MKQMRTWRAAALFGGGASLLLAIGIVGACSGETGGVDLDADAGTADGGSSGDGSTGQDGGSNGDGSTGQDGGTDAAGDAGCTVSADGGSIGCGPGYYCESPNCAEGQCVRREKPDAAANMFDPVCGCSGVTYWNDAIARGAGESLRDKGECKAPVHCGGPGPFKACPGDARCNMRMDSGTGCIMQSQPGVCWGMPEKCPPQLIGSGLRGCGEGSCRSSCELITDQTAYYPDKTCPM